MRNIKGSPNNNGHNVLEDNERLVDRQQATASYHIIINHSPHYKEKDKHNIHIELSDSIINCKNKYMHTIPSDIIKINNSNKLDTVPSIPEKLKLLRSTENHCFFYQNNPTKYIHFMDH